MTFDHDIRYLYLKNSGGYIVTLKALVNGDKSDDGNEIAIGQSTTLDLNSLGVAQGATVQIYCDVMWGDDMTGTEEFVYSANSLNQGKYECTGTTEDDHLNYTGWGP